MDTANASSPGKVVLRGATKTFVDRKRGRETIALGDVSLVDRDEQLRVPAGPSGCGKSTILNLVAGFEQRVSGEVLLDGAAIASTGAGPGHGFPAAAAVPVAQHHRQHHLRADAWPAGRPNSTRRSPSGTFS